MEIAIRTPDAVTIAIYVLAMAAAGVYFTRFNRTTEQFFLGDRSFSGWVIGLSMMGTIVSSATFLALPAAAYVLDWRQLSVNLVLPFVAVVAVIVIIPFFRRGKMTSAFEYLGLRYGQVPRLYGTLSFVTLQIIRMAQVLFLVSLPIQFLTGAPIHWVIIGVGAFIAFYTIAGGITAVVWTDVVQAIILMLGGILCFVVMAFDLPGGMQQILRVGAEEGKFSLGSFDWDLAERTFWTVAILGVINWLGIYSGDQNMVQRYIAARSLREARKATIIFSVIALPIWTSFFFVGTSLFVYYQTFPDSAVLEMDADQVLPYFILTEVPVVLAGLIVSAVMAAAMSSLDSGINSISTVTVTDLLKPYLARNRDDRFYLLAARFIAGGVGALVVGIAIVFSLIDKESMNDVSLIVTSVFGGCLMGLFLMGFFTRRVDGVSAAIAMALAILFNVYLGLGLLGWLPDVWTLGVHSYWVGGLVNGAFFVLAYGISFVRRKPQPNLEGLTVWTMSSSGDRRQA